jgi:hypothetical protein
VLDCLLYCMCCVWLIACDLTECGEMQEALEALCYMLEAVALPVQGIAQDSALEATRRAACNATAAAPASMRRLSNHETVCSSGTVHRPGSMVWPVGTSCECNSATALLETVNVAQTFAGAAGRS